MRPERSSGVGVIGKVSMEDGSLAICNKCFKQVSQGGKKLKNKKIAPALISSNLKSHLRHKSHFNGVLKAYENASAAKDGSNIKAAVKKPAGLLLIVKEICQR